MRSRLCTCVRIGNSFMLLPMNLLKSLTPRFVFSKLWNSHKHFEIKKTFLVSFKCRDLYLLNTEKSKLSYLITEHLTACILLPLAAVFNWPTRIRMRTSFDLHRIFVFKILAARTACRNILWPVRFDNLIRHLSTRWIFVNLIVVGWIDVLS